MRRDSKVVQGAYWKCDAIEHWELLPDAEVRLKSSVTVSVPWS